MCDLLGVVAANSQIWNSQKKAFLFFFFNRHSYTNLKTVNWSKVSITEPDVKKYIDRK